MHHHVQQQTVAYARTCPGCARVTSTTAVPPVCIIDMDRQSRERWVIATCLRGFLPRTFSRRPFGATESVCTLLAGVMA